MIGRWLSQAARAAPGSRSATARLPAGLRPRRHACHPALRCRRSIKKAGKAIRDYGKKITDLAADTCLSAERDQHIYSLELSRDWNGFGPLGGYLASIAVRAAGLDSGRALPASLQCTFLRQPVFGRIQVLVDTMATTKRATASEVVLRQQDVTFARAVVWTVDDGLDGIVHNNSPMPNVEPPDAYTSIETILPSTVEVRFGDIWKSVEDRPINYDFENWCRPLDDPRILGWYRFRPASKFADWYVDAARPIILTDMLQFGAALASSRSGEFVAVSLDLTVHFHRPCTDSDWLLVEADSPVARAGLVNGRAAIWSADGALIATGCQQMLCRPVRK